MKQITLFISGLLIINSCGNQYYMSNMLGDDKVNISQFIKEGYRPVYCNKKIIKLINPKTVSISNSDSLLKAFQAWLNNNNLSMRVDKNSLLKKTKYSYSYLIAYDPVEVFRLEFQLDTRLIILYIRQEEGNLIYPFQEDDWIISECD